MKSVIQLYCLLTEFKNVQRCSEEKNPEGKGRIYHISR